MANTKIPSELVAINAISGTLIADNAITSVHIAENNITATQIAINAVTALQMADGTITSAKIADGTIVTADIADGQITTGKIADSSVTTGKIAAGTILSSDIANNAILTQHIDDNQITADQIADNAVGLDQMAGLTRGSVIYGNSAGNPAYLAAGTNGHVLTSDGTDISWTADTDLFLATAGGTVTGDLILKSDGGEDVINVVHSGNTVKLVSIGQSSDNSGNGVIQLKRNNGVLHAQIHSHGNSYFNGGNVGIGFASGTPQDYLEINGSGNGLGGLTISNSSHNHAALSFARSSTATARIFTTEPDATHTSQFNFQTSNASGGSPNLVTAMVIDDHQNVGIGETSPDGLLHLKGGTATGDASHILFENTQGDKVFAIGGGATGVTNSHLYFRNVTDNTRPMVITDAGNIGIGGIIPVSRLHLESANVGTNGAVVHFLQNVATNGPTMLIEQTGGGGNQNVNHGLLIKVDGQNGGLGNALQVLGTNDNLNSGTDIKALTVKNGGNVGIGTDTPSYNLDVRDGIVFAGRAVSDDGGISYTNTAAVFSSRGVDHDAARSNVLRLMRDGTSGVQYAGVADFDLESWESSSVHSRTAMTLKLGHGNLPDATDVMTWRSNGNVGIGTTTPTAPLQLNTAGNTVDGTYYSTFTINNTGSSTWSRLRFDRGGVARWGLSLGTDDKFKINNLYTGGSVATPDDNVLVIDNNSNVGIGTSTPGAKLEISGKDDSGASDLLRLQFDNSPGDTGITFTDINSTVKNRITMDSTNTADLRISSGTKIHLYGGTTNGTSSPHLTVSNTGHITMPNQPSFMIGSMQSAAGNVWTSAKTFHNNGSHFNTSNGRFTAPIAGFYFFFHWGMLTTSTGSQDADVYHRLNGTRTQAGTAYSGQTGGNYNQFSCSYIVYMAVNDYADVYWSSGTPYGTSDGRHGAFGGYLIG